MLRAGVGISVSHNPRTATLEACAAAMTQAGLATATGAIFFATTAHGGAFPLILRTVAEQTKTAQVAGCSGVGVIASESEVESGHAISVLVFGGTDVNAKRLFAPMLRGRGREVALELAASIKPALGSSSNLLCIFADTYNMDAEPFLDAIQAELPGVVIVGGGASEDGSIGETFQFCGNTVSSNSVSGMLISGDFDLNVGASLACTQIGPTHRVTEVRDNVVISLDGRPAYEVFAEAAGPLADDLRRALSFVFIGIPLDDTPDRLQRGRFLVRNIVGASAEHGVIAVAHHPQVGDALGLVLRNGERAREDLKATLEELSAKSPSPAAFGLYFDCVSRGAGLYNIPGHDTAYIRQYLGAVPVAGFFTGFEIGPLADEVGLLQYSGVLVLVSEKTPQ
jgi:small ligand-binding sensory domain FIST